MESGVVILASLGLAAALAWVFFRVLPVPDVGVPTARGWPILGSLPDIASNPAGFIKRCFSSLGYSWVARVGPQSRIFFFTNPFDHATVYKLTSVLTNRPWVTAIGSALAGVPAKTVDLCNDDTTASLFHRYLVAPKELAATTQLIAVELSASLMPGGRYGMTEGVSSSVVDLRDWCGRALFAAGVHGVVGSALDADTLYPEFLAVDASFGPLAAGVPPAFFPRFRSARAAIVSALHAAYDSPAAVALRKAAREPDAALAASPTSRPVAPLLTSRVEYHATLGISQVRNHGRWWLYIHFTAPSYPVPFAALVQSDALAIFTPFIWALHANTSLALFWLLAHLACDAASRAAVEAEVDAAWGAAAGDVAALAGADLGASLPLLTSACWETLRLYSYAFGARSATADVDVPLVGGGSAGDTAPKVAHVRRGDNVLLVVQHHRDAAAFPDPDAFVANRFVASDASSVGGNRFFLDGRDLTAGGPVRPFGGGKSMCPGRFIALNEMRIFAAVLMRHYSFGSDAACSPPLPDMKGSGIGVLPPASPLQVRLTQRRATHL